MSSVLRLSLKLVLTSALLGLLLYFVPLREVAGILSNVSPVYLALGVLLQFVMRAVATPRMRVIAQNQGMDIGHRRLFGILLTTQYYALMLPGTLTAGGATWLKYVQAGGEKGAALAAVLLNRGIAMLVMVLTGSMALLMDRALVQSGELAIAVAVFAVILLLLAFGRLPIELSPAGASRQEGWLQWPLALAGRLLQFQQIPPRGKLVVLISSLATELVGALTMWCFALAVGLSVDFLSVIWMRAALQIVLMAPLHVAGFGIREASLVGMGALLGVAPAAALAWSLVIFTGTLVVSAAGGLLEANAAARLVSRSREGVLADARGDAKP